MGILNSQWEADWKGHHLVVARNELTRGFWLKCDGEEIASKSVSLSGAGSLEAEIVEGDSTHIVRVALSSGCDIGVDGEALVVRTVK